MIKKNPIKNVKRTIKVKPSNKRRNKSGVVGKTYFGERKIRIKGEDFLQRVEYERLSKKLVTKIKNSKGEVVHATSFKLKKEKDGLHAEIDWPVTRDNERGKEIFYTALKNSLPVLKRAGVKQVNTLALRASDVYIKLGFKEGTITGEGRWYFKKL
jgi:hypothetical protein